MQSEKKLFGSKINRIHRVSSSISRSPRSVSPLTHSKSLTNLKELNNFYHDYFRFEIKCGNTILVYEKKNINRSISN
jgi:hypothetical protein